MTERLKMPLAKKLSILFFVLFVAIFTIFTLVAYVSTNNFLLKEEQIAVERTVDHITARVAEADARLTMGNLREVLYEGATTDDLVLTPDGLHIVRSERDITNMVFSNQTIYIYGEEKNFIFTTDRREKAPAVSAINKAVEYEFENAKGFLFTKPVYGKTSGELIGYVQVFHDLGLYYTLKDRLIGLLVLVLLLGAGLALLMIRLSTQRFLEPLHALHDVMTAIGNNPSEMSLRSNIQTGDEIEELSSIFDGMLDRVEDYSRLQSRFVSDVSHELRTPVAVIKGHLDLLQRWGKHDPAILDESLEASRAEAERMTIMINDMLDMIRVQGSFEQHKQDKTELSESLETVMGNFRVLHPEFTYHFDHGFLGEVWAKIYKNHFEQAVTILVDNAVKYSPHRKDIALSLRREDQYAVVSIRDRGEGISEEDIKHIFDRFYRTDKSRHRAGAQAGLGLGLSILKQITEAYHCHLEVDSEVGVGTTFSLSIPLVD